MSLSMPIDAHSSTKHLKFDQFFYLLTIPNVKNNEDCWFHLRINFSNFKQDTSSNKIDSQL